MINSSLWASRRWLVVLAACVTSTTLFAQSPTAASIDGLLLQSNEVLRQMDSRDVASTWEKASRLMRESTKKEDFVARVESDRASLDPISSRIWQTMRRISYRDGNAQRIPPGDYININFLAIDDKGQLLSELISFRLEDDQQWRMTGYVSQKATAK